MLGSFEVARCGRRLKGVVMVARVAAASRLVELRPHLTRLSAGRERAIFTAAAVLDTALVIKTVMHHTLRRIEDDSVSARRHSEIA